MSEQNREETQRRVNQAAGEAKAEWERKLSESGLSQHMFILTDQTGFARSFLAEYQSTKDYVESAGFVMPDIFPGIEISVTDQE